MLRLPKAMRGAAPATRMKSVSTYYQNRHCGWSPTIGWLAPAMHKQARYQKTSIYISRRLHFLLKFAAIGEHKSLSEFAEGLLSSALAERKARELLSTDQDDDQTG
jgi:hypothetical protein